MRKSKWLIYTVLIGLIPFFIRFFVFIVRRDLHSNYILNEIDMITFGLILHVTNINELFSYKNSDKNWKEINIGLSIFMLVIFSSFLGLTYFADVDKSSEINRTSIKYMSLILSLVSFFSSYSIYDRISKIQSR